MRQQRSIGDLGIVQPGHGPSGFAHRHDRAETHQPGAGAPAAADIRCANDPCADIDHSSADVDHSSADVDRCRTIQLSGPSAEQHVRRARGCNRRSSGTAW